MTVFAEAPMSALDYGVHPFHMGFGAQSYDAFKVIHIIPQTHNPLVLLRAL